VHWVPKRRAISAIRASDSGGVDADLVCTYFEKALGVELVANAATHRERDRED
jgi:hypothetical protein